MEQLQQCHVVLYAKGWYETSDNIFEDLKKVLTLDDYTPETNNDVLSIFLARFEEAKIPNSGVFNFYCGIHPRNTYKVNYRHSTDGFSEPLPSNEYDIQLATVYYLLSTVRFLKHDQYKWVKPIYSKELKRPRNIKKSRVEELFQKEETV